MAENNEFLYSDHTRESSHIFEDAKLNFNTGNFHTAFKKYTDYINLQINYLKNVTTIGKSNAISFKSCKKRVLIALPFSISAYILDRNIWTSNIKIDELKILLMKEKQFNISQLGLSEFERISAIEIAIRAVILRWHNKVRFIDVNDVSTFNIDDFSTFSRYEKLVFLKKFLLTDLSMLRSAAQSHEDYLLVSQQYLKLAATTYELNQNTESLDFCEFSVEASIYKTYASTNLSTFKKNYEKLSSDLNKYVSINFNSSESIRKEHLDLASALSFGLTLAKKVDDKIELTQKIVDNFLAAGSYNAYRYKVYLDWFQISLLITNSNISNIKAAKSMRNQIADFDSIAYIDRDEQFLAISNPEILKTRKNLKTILLFMVMLTVEKPFVKSTGSSILDSSLILHKADLLELGTAFEIMKRFVGIELVLENTPRPLQLYSSDNSELLKYKKIIEDGENETVEFKSSWVYSLKTNNRSNDVKHSALKTMAAFMNSAGGTLFIGISDNGSTFGLEHGDFHVVRGSNDQEQKDNFKLEIDTAVSEYMTTSSTSLYVIRFEVDDEKTFAIIFVRKAPIPVWLKDYDDKYQRFYIRSSAGSRELVGADLSNHLVRQKT